MFERRLKIILACLCAATIVLGVRAAQVQVWQRDRWRHAADETMKRPQLTATVRGSILDCKGRVIARDEACVDACVDYRAIIDPPDPAWVNDRALDRLRRGAGGDYAKASRSQRAEMLEREARAVRQDIARMWVKLAQVGADTPEQVNDTRAAIMRRVEMRQRLVWYRNYQRAMQKSDDGQPEPFWEKWLTVQKNDPDIDKFAVIVSDQTEAHVILQAIDNQARNELGKHIERYPGLVLRSSTHRVYPFGPTACHLLGRVSKVNQDDLRQDPEQENELRQYLPNDDIGRGGAEGLCERALRGSKGRIERIVGESEIRDQVAPVPGKDVHVTIDMELQARIEDAFAHGEWTENDRSIARGVLHGACVVIDVPTGEVRALVSYPTYDPNTFDEHYADLHDDLINHPLMNRATMAQLQPGSTIKPIVGLSAITAGVFAPTETIECTGFLVINGRRQSVGRCWVESKFGAYLRSVGMSSAHHPVPTEAPHPTGFLTYGDALERSCNVFFETVADRMGMDRLSAWYEKFGLGRPTGIGIPEAHGRLPSDFKGPLSERKYKTWFSGIGQDPVAVTPIQMANAVSTIARDGIWMRPRLVSDQEAARDGITAPILSPRPGEPAAPVPDHVDLHLSPAGLAEARDGMYRVVNGAAGTGKQIMVGAQKLTNILICGKTGTAQAPRFAVKVLDAHHHPILNEHGRPIYRFLEPGTVANPNPEAPWYRGYGADGKDLNHAWYIGFAPADHPRVAFAVMVEYGGSGGAVAGVVARKALEACVDNGYLK